MRNCWLILFVLLLLAGCETQKQWTDTAPLARGGSISYIRDVVIRPNEFFEPERGPIRIDRLTFLTGKGRITAPDRIPGLPDLDPNLTLYVYAPLIVEVVDGELVIVYSVSGEACDTFGVAEEGLVAFRYHQGTWVRAPLSILPAGTRTNIRPPAKQAPTEPFEGEPIADLIKQSQSDQFGCLNRIESRRQAARSGDFQAGYSSNVSTMKMPEPYSQEVEAADTKLFVVYPSFGKKFDSGCEDIKVDQQVVGPLIRFHLDSTPQNFVDVPRCNEFCENVGVGYSCSKSVLGVATLVRLRDNDRRKLIIFRLGRDRKLIRTDSVFLPPLVKGDYWGWWVSQTFSLSDPAQVELVHRVTVDDKHVKVDKYLIEIPPIN